MDKLKAYWIKKEFPQVRFVKNIDEPWDDLNGGEVSPPWFKENYKSVCLFSRMEIGKNCWVKVWFYNGELKRFFRHERTREEFAYWVDPEWLEEVEL